MSITHLPTSAPFNETTWEGCSLPVVKTFNFLEACEKEIGKNNTVYTCVEHVFPVIREFVEKCFIHAGETCSDVILNRADIQYYDNRRRLINHETEFLREKQIELKQTQLQAGKSMYTYYQNEIFANQLRIDQKNQELLIVDRPLPIRGTECYPTTRKICEKILQNTYHFDEVVALAEKKRFYQTPLFVGAAVITLIASAIGIHAYLSSKKKEKR